MKRLSVLFLVLLLTGCAVTLPKYDGEITPITTPTSFEYAPAEGRIFTSAYVSFGSDKAFVKMSTPYAITRSRDELSWNIKLDSFTVDRKLFKPQSPIVDATMTTTRKGKILNVDVLFPALTASGKSIIKGTKEYDDMVRAISDDCSQLNEQAIVSGDPLMVTKNSTFRFADSEKRGFETTLAGYGSYKGRKVVIGSIQAKDAHMIIENEGKEVDFIGSFSGYTINDAATMAVLRAEIGIVGRVINDGKNISMSIDVFE